VSTEGCLVLLTPLNTISTEMATLVSIPRELRDQILDHVIQSHQNERPALDQTFGELVENREILKSPKLGSWCNTVLNIPESVTPNATNLLLVNRQIHSETLQAIKRLNARTLELDVIILDEILPLPTWIHVPTSSTSLDKVNVTFRISGRYDRRKEKRDSSNSSHSYSKYGFFKGFRGSDGSGPAMDWQTYSILERFIRAGPVGTVSADHAHRHMTVKSLVINVETPPGIDEVEFSAPRSSNFRRVNNDAALTVLDPAYLARSINGNMRGLLGCGHEWFRYGQILYEHVNTVTIQVNGEDLNVLDVAERLRDVGGFEEKYVSSEALAEYKRVTWEKRGQRGLKVIG
jgi:hypothetical protein